MTILENLKKVFEGKSGDILSNNNITFFNFSKNTNEVVEVKDGNKLVIDLSKANEEQKKQVKNILDLIVQSENEVFLMDHSSEKTLKIKRSLPQGESEELLKFYKEKLNPEMYKALEASVIVKNVFDKGEDILEMKRDISRKYPTFGNNLCNLVTRGYFDKHFKELYQSMLEDEEFDINLYQRKVERIIKSLPYTVFITRFKSYDELSGEVRFKLERLKKYGTGKLLLHGLGRENVNTTMTLLEEYKEENHINIQIEINQKRTIITATLIF